MYGVMVISIKQSLALANAIGTLAKRRAVSFIVTELQVKDINFFVLYFCELQ